MNSPAVDPPPAPPKALDRDQFLKRSNISLRRIELSSLVILVIGGLLAFLFFRERGLSFLIGGSLAMAHFRSLHRMFQNRILNPSARLKTQFFYSLTLFLMICSFFWVTQYESISLSGIIIGFLLITGSVFFESSRQ